MWSGFLAGPRVLSVVHRDSALLGREPKGLSVAERAYLLRGTRLQP